MKRMNDEMTTTLRRARPGDSEAIAMVHILARREAMPYLPDVHSEADTQDWIAHIVLPNQDVWVVERTGRVVGVAALDGQTLEQLYVLPGEQGSGVGSVLLQKAIETVDETLTLWTFQRNAAARAFYEHRDFVSIEFTDGEGNEEREPDVRYQWSGAAEKDTR